MKIIDRDYFSKIHAIVNGANYNHNETNYSINIGLGLDDKRIRPMIFRDLTTNGFAIVKAHTDEPNIIAHLLEDIFEESLSDKNPGKKLYAKVQSEKNAKHYIASSLAQPIHTDEGYALEYPRYVALYCVKPSADGGISIVVPFKPLYNKLQEQFGRGLEIAFIKDSLKVESFIGVIEKPLLIELDNGDTGISYSPVLQKLYCSEEAFKLFDFVTTYVHDLNNQMRFTLKADEVLLIDNCLALHGRTAFFKNTDRLLYRYWFGNRTL